MISNKKNVLIIAYNDLNNSGVPNVIYQIIKTQHNQYNFDILVFNDNMYYYEKIKSEEIDNVNVIKCRVKKPQTSFAKVIYYLYKRNKQYYSEALTIFRKKQYVAVHSFKEYDSGPFLKAAKKAKISKRIIHTTVIHEKSKSLIEKKCKKLALKFGNVFIGVTKPACQKAFPRKDFKVIHFAYDEQTFNMDVKSRLSDEQLILTQVGTYSSNKNQLFSIELMNYLRILQPNAKLKLIGKENEMGYKRKIEEAIERYGLNDSIELIDGSNGIGSNLEYTSFYLLTSLREGASLVVIESQACGIAVFASSAVFAEMNVGGIRFLDLKDGPKRWAEEINSYFLRNKNRRTKYNLSSFSKESFAKAIECLYKD